MNSENYIGNAKFNSRINVEGNDLDPESILPDETASKNQGRIKIEEKDLVANQNNETILAPLHALQHQIDGLQAAV